MKNDESKSTLKIMQLKSANKSTSRKNINKNDSYNRFTPINKTISKLENSNYLTSDKKLRLDFASNKVVNREFDHNLNQEKYANNLKINKVNVNIIPKKIESIGKNLTSNNNLNNFGINKKSRTSQKLFKVNSQANFSMIYYLNDDVYANREHHLNKNVRGSIDKRLNKSPIHNLNNNNNKRIKIENINNIQNYKNYQIFKRSNSVNKFDKFTKKDLQSFLNLKTHISNFNNFEYLDKNARTEPKNYSRNKPSFYNYEEIDKINLFGDSNPVKVVVRFRPMNRVENVTLHFIS